MQEVRLKMTKEEHDKLVHFIEHGAIHDIDTGRLDGKCESVIPVEDAIAVIDSVFTSTDNATET